MNDISFIFIFIVMPKSFLGQLNKEPKHKLLVLLLQHFLFDIFINDLNLISVIICELYFS